MSRNIELENRIIWIFILFKVELKPSLVALANLPIFIVHRAKLFLLELLRISLFFLSHFVFIHLFIHLSSCLFSIMRSHLIFFFLTHIFLSLFSLSLFCLSFLQLQFSNFNSFIEWFLKCWKHLFGFYSLRRCNNFTIVTL